MAKDTLPRGSKTEIRKWLARCREDIRDIEAAVKAEDWETVTEMANDLSGSACEITTITSPFEGY